MGKSPVRDEVSIVSPLRYPGAKRRLSTYVAEVLRVNELRPKVLIEPFAGGASVALQLACTQAVEKIALGELDPLVASFWKVVFREPEWLIGAIRKQRVSLAAWDRFRNGCFRSNRKRALACIFLNRTSFSGIIAKSAGPIGGRNQQSEYGIDCRFTKATIIRRIQNAARLRDRVLLVHRGHWLETVQLVKARGYKSDELFLYLDPPFYHEASRLYNCFFNQGDHKDFHDELLQLDIPYLLSYDPAKEIRQMYSHNGRGPKRIDLLYTAASTNQQHAQELVITNLPRLPKGTRIWKSKEEWNTKRR